MNTAFSLEAFLLLLFCGTRNFISTVLSEDANLVSNSTTASLDEEIRFFLYTRNNSRQNVEQLRVNDTQSVSFSTYDAKHPTKFVTHGWLGSKDSESCTLIRDAFLFHDYYNVIVIDWTNTAKLSLKQIVARIPRIASRVAEMIEFLVSHGCDHGSISLIGHSMGALLMGSVGHQTSNKVGHLVGMDPASPLRLAHLDENIIPKEVRSISKSDAEFVEIIYTLQGRSEVIGALGHAEFYPNGGGPTQPGCSIDDKDPNECPHNRAYILYAEAIKWPEKLIARKCRDFETFTAGNCANNSAVQFPNWSTDKKENGLFYLRTAGSSPFGLGLDGIKPE